MPCPGDNVQPGLYDFSHTTVRTVRARSTHKIHMNHALFLTFYFHPLFFTPLARFYRKSPLEITIFKNTQLQSRYTQLSDYLHSSDQPHFQKSCTKQPLRHVKKEANSAAHRTTRTVFLTCPQVWPARCSGEDKAGTAGSPTHQQGEPRHAPDDPKRSHR